jgi:hypothetical protein
MTHDYKANCWPKNYQISDDKIAEVWGNSNFGSRTRREVILDCLAQISAGYSTGSTATRICRELGFVCGKLGEPKLTKLGNKYLYHATQDHISDLILGRRIMSEAQDGKLLLVEKRQREPFDVTEFKVVSSIEAIQSAIENYRQGKPINCIQTAHLIKAAHMYCLSAAPKVGV